MLRDAVKSMLNEFVAYVRRRRSELAERYGKKMDRKVYVCRDNDRVYLARPRKCSNVYVTRVEDLVERDLRESIKPLIARLSAWRWLAEHCSDAVGDGEYYESCRCFYFDGGRILVYGIDEPAIYVYFAKGCPSERFDSIVECLKRCPYRVEIRRADEDAR